MPAVRTMSPKVSLAPGGLERYSYGPDGNARPAKLTPYRYSENRSQSVWNKWPESFKYESDIEARSWLTDWYPTWRPSCGGQGIDTVKEWGFWTNVIGAPYYGLQNIGQAQHFSNSQGITFWYMSKDSTGACVNRHVSDDAAVLRAKIVYCADAGFYFKGGVTVNGGTCAPAFTAWMEGPPVGCSSPAGEECVGNPINILTGEKKYVEEDFDFDGMRFSRFYSSFTQDISIGLPRPWSYSFFSRLSEVAYESGAGNRCIVNYDSCLWNSSIKIIREQSRTIVLNEDKIREVFDASGRMVRREHVGGRSYDITYVEGVVNSIKSDSGRTLRFIHADGLLSKIMNEHGETMISFGYDISGRLTSSADSSGIQSTYEYANSNYSFLLTAVRDAGGKLLASYDYDTSGRAVFSSTHGDVVSVDYNDIDRRVDVNDNGIHKIYSIETNGGHKYLASKAVGSSVKEWTWDSLGERIVEEAEGILKKTFSYDSSGQHRALISESSSGQSLRSRQMSWSSEGPWILEEAVRDEGGVQIANHRYKRNLRGQVVMSESTAINGLARVTTKTYCEQADIDAETCPLLGLLTKIDGPRTDVSDVITYTYYLYDNASCVTSSGACTHRKGDLWKVVNGLGHVTETLAYDGAGRVLSVRSPSGVITDFEYHPRGWLTARKLRGAENTAETDDAITRIDYEPTGLVKRVMQSDGTFTAYTYDAAHRLTAISDNLGNRIVYTLDSAGNRIKEDTQDSGGGCYARCHACTTSSASCRPQRTRTTGRQHLLTTQAATPTR